MADERRKQRLSVTAQTPVFTKPGGATLYTVVAYDENGMEVPDLRTFAELPKHELVEYELKRYDHPEYGTTWTILAPSGGLGKRVGELEARLAKQEERIAAVEARFGDPERRVHPAQRTLEDGEVRGPDFLPA